MNLQPDPTNIISSFLRTIRGKLTPPDLTQIHPTGFRFPPRSTTHRFTVQKPSQGDMVPLKRVPEVMRNDVIMFHPVVQRFTLQR
jgi:hypothetical protein